MVKQTNKSPDTSPAGCCHEVVSRKTLLKAGAATMAGTVGLAALDGVGTALASTPPRAARKTSVTLTLWTHASQVTDFFTERAKVWEKRYPQYSFHYNFVVIPYDQLFTKVLGNLAAGTGAPDLVGIEINAFSRFMHGNIARKGLVDLTPLIGTERHKFVRWEPYMIKGRIYGVETALSPSAMYYRPDIFKQAGISTPIATYDDLLAAGRTLAKQNKYSLMVPMTALDVFTQLFYQVGGHLFDQSGALTLDDPRAVAVLEYLVKGVKDKAFYAPPDMEGAPTVATLKLGRAASAVMPDWYAQYTLEPDVKEEKGKWRLQNLPAWPSTGRRIATLGGTGMAITQQCKHQDLAWSLLHFSYMTLESQIKRFQETGFFPTMKEAFHDPRITNVPDPYFGGEKIGAVFAKYAADVPKQYQSPFWNEATTQLTNEYTNALRGQKTPARAIKDATASIRKIMARGS